MEFEEQPLSPGQLQTIKGKNKALWLNEGHLCGSDGMVDIADLKSADCEVVRVRIPLPAPSIFNDGGLCYG